VSAEEAQAVVAMDRVAAAAVVVDLVAARWVEVAKEVVEWMEAASQGVGATKAPGMLAMVAAREVAVAVAGRVAQAAEADKWPNRPQTASCGLRAHSHCHDSSPQTSCPHSPGVDGRIAARRGSLADRSDPAGRLGCRQLCQSPSM
jgi:hypothetical protein